MRQAARISDYCGGIIVTGASSVIVEGKQFAFITSVVSPHGTHGSPSIVTGSAKVIVEGKGAARIGSVAACGHHVTTGATKVFVGG